MERPINGVIVPQPVMATQYSQIQKINQNLHASDLEGTFKKIEAATGNILHLYEKIYQNFSRSHTAMHLSGNLLQVAEGKEWKVYADELKSFKNFTEGSLGVVHTSFQMIKSFGLKLEYEDKDIYAIECLPIVLSNLDKKLSHLAVRCAQISEIFSTHQVLIASKLDGETQRNLLNEIKLRSSAIREYSYQRAILGEGIKHLPKILKKIFTANSRLVTTQTPVQNTAFSQRLNRLFEEQETVSNKIKKLYQSLVDLHQENTDKDKSFIMLNNIHYIVQAMDNKNAVYCWNLISKVLLSKQSDQEKINQQIKGVSDKVVHLYSLSNNYNHLLEESVSAFIDISPRASELDVLKQMTKEVTLAQEHVRSLSIDLLKPLEKTPIIAADTENCFGGDAFKHAMEQAILSGGAPANKKGI